MGDMDYPEGFFPERQILAMRRRQLLPPMDPVQPADSRRKPVWIALGIAIFCPLWTFWCIGAVKRPEVLLVVCYVLAVFSLAGAVIGLYRGLRSRKLSTQT